MPDQHSYEELIQRIAKLEAQNKNLQSEAIKYRTLFDSFPHGITVSDSDGNVMEANSISEQLLGINKKDHKKREISGKEWRIIDKEGNDMPVNEWASVIALKENRLVTDCEMGIVKSASQITWLTVTAAPIPIEGYGVVITYNDITEKKKAEKKLRESEKRYKNIFNNKHVAMLVIDPETGSIIDANPSAAAFYGWSQSEMTKMNIKEINTLSQDDLTNAMQKTKNQRGKLFHFQHRLKHGSIRDVEVASAPVEYDEKIHLFSIVHDITETKSIEAQLRQARKMESVGTMAGGIAHDFNNILYMMIGNAELAMEDIPEWNPVHDNLKEIKAAGLRAAGIVKQLLNFSRQTDQEFKPIGAVTVIKDALKFIRSTIPTSIEIKQSLPGTEVTIHGDPVQINQVMMNLCINASQAMEETGGILEIAVEKINVNKSMNNSYPDLDPGEWLKITVSDTGPGISSEVAERIFDPYFTTKDVGKGSGMGLSVVHGIVINHRGKIFVDSNLGKGAIFTIYFPVVTGKPVMDARTPDEISKGTGEKVLFVDDEASIAKMAGKMLERRGYTIETETSPINALERFRSKPDAFDLVITDMTMPNLTGVKLTEKLKELRPDIPVIICTGHSALIDESKAKEIGIDGYSMKPIVMRDMAKTIRDVMDKKKSKRT